MTRTLLPFRVQRGKLPKKVWEEREKRKIVKITGKAFKYRSSCADTWMRTNVSSHRRETDGEGRWNEQGEN